MQFFRDLPEIQLAQLPTFPFESVVESLDITHESVIGLWDENGKMNRIACLHFCFDADIDVRMKDPIAARNIEGLTLEGEIENDSDGTQTGALPIVDLGLDIDPTKQTKDKR